MRIFVLLPLLASAYDWSPVDRVLSDAIANGTFPGCAAAVTNQDGNVVLLQGYGTYVYPSQHTPVGGNNPSVTPDSLFDMASLTKILGATTAAAVLYQRGLLDLDMLVDDPSLLGPAFSGQGKGGIRIRNLLLHDAGYPPDPSPGYSDPAFGCPATALESPPLTFNCSERVFTSLLSQTLRYPTGTSWLYSDLSMITMQYALGTLIHAHGLVQAHELRPDCAGASPDSQPGLLRTCYFEAFVRVHILGALGMKSTGFLPPAAEWPLALPTWNDSTYRHAAIQGRVSDENSYALGGIAGHAGIFSSAAEVVSSFTRMWMYGPYYYNAGCSSNAATATASGEGDGARCRAFLAAPPPVALLNATTVNLFTTVANASFSPRALGWLTQTPLDTYQGCGGLAPTTFYHTGYTGTLICGDPTRNVTTVLLTNRVWPDRGNVPEIQAARQAFNDAVLVVLGKGHGTGTAPST